MQKQNNKVKQKRKGGDRDCYLLQICSDRVKNAAPEAEKPDNSRWPPLRLEVEYPDANPPKNPRSKTPLWPASPEWTSVSNPADGDIRQPDAQTTPLDVPFGYPLVTPVSSASAVVAPVQRKLPILEPFRGPRVIPVSQGGGVTRPTAAGKVTVPSHSTDPGWRNKAYAANRVGAKTNLAIAGLDLANSFYEAWQDGRVQDVEDAINFVSKYPDDVARGLRFAGEEAYNAILNMDAVALGEVARSLTPIPTTVRTARNLMPDTWHERDTVGMSLDEKQVNALRPQLIGDVSVEDTVRNLQAGWDNLAKGADSLVRSLSGIPWRW